jgi:predicted RNase H-like HicB family nuclease
LLWQNQKKKKGIKMREKLTAVFRKSKYGYIGYVEELPGANTQGKTLEETKKNLIEAIQLVLEANRQMAEEEQTDVEVIKEQLGEVAI